MNNNIEVIGIDHGWSQMKTSNTCFNTSIKELANAPAFHDNVLEYDDRYFAVGEERLEVLDSKVENENFYLLTLVAMAKELEIRGKSEADVVLAVGLPLTRFSAERKPFIDYLSQNRDVVFGFEQKLYTIHILNVLVYPQCYAAVAGMLPAFGKKALVIDVGSWTVDSMLIVNKKPDNSNYVNPLAMDVWNLDQNDTKGWVREKGEFMLGLCEQCIGDSLNSRQKSIIDRCVRKMYIDIARSREKYIPVMSDFYDILMAQPEEEAKEIALSLELFVNGSLNIFNHQTNVDVDNRFVVYGIRDLGTELSPITMLVMMESIQQRIVENGKRGKATWLYIDEFHVLLNSEYSAKYLQQLWKKVRKQGGLCTGITQNVVDLLQNYTATTMLANSEFVALLKQANTDSSKMAEVIGVSDAQLRFVTNSQSGMGLLKCGNVVIPFDNQIGKDTSLYKLYNTNIHEKIAEQRAKENHVSVV